MVVTKATAGLGVDSVDGAASGVTQQSLTLKATDILNAQKMMSAARAISAQDLVLSFKPF